MVWSFVKQKAEDEGLRSRVVAEVWIREREREGCWHRGGREGRVREREGVIQERWEGERERCSHTGEMEWRERDAVIQERWNGERERETVRREREGRERERETDICGR